MPTPTLEAHTARTPLLSAFDGYCRDMIAECRERYEAGYYCAERDISRLTLMAVHVVALERLAASMEVTEATDIAEALSDIITPREAACVFLAACDLERANAV